MWLAWFDTKAVDALAERLVRDLLGATPPDDPATPAKRRDAKLRKAHERVLTQASEFAAKQKLNLYQKARLANRVKWGLLDANCPKWFVDELAYELAATVGSPKAAPPR
jgi:non-ribosomal peptide synthetase component F